MIEIVLATANPHKVDELRQIFANVNTNVISLGDLPNHSRFHEPVENGATFAANAEIKARSYAAQTQRLCLADDSGLEVDALGGAPGVISSHYSTEGRETGLTRPQRDEANNQRLLRELANIPLERRSARFVCHMCLVGPAGNVLATSRGAFEGRIGLPFPEAMRASESPVQGGADPLLVPRGMNGFGYDPLFLVAPDFTRTSAELSADMKNSLSHRGQAARVLSEFIRRGVIGL
ncbi:MAG: non-canonical purine NTP pyrophosphatase [Pyrinomonadaceae bacterium]|nr:non-canonical purine NTP pyrophosphatase [Phycisphaerales bacterium]